MLRRAFLQSAGAAAAAVAAPAAPIKLGFDSYSIGWYRWKDIQLLDYAASLKLDTVQISSLGDFESLEPAHLARVKDHARRLNLQVDAGTGCICPSSQNYPKNGGDAAEALRKALRAAHAVGSTSLRCYLGAGNDRRGKLPIEAHMENTIQVFRAVRQEALDLGVKVAIENHSGDLQAREVRTVIEQAGRDFVGACLDTGNCIWVVEDPLFALELLHPYIVTTHIRDTAVWEHPRGCAAMWVALGEGSIDFTRFIARYRELGVQAAMQLEVITGRPPQVLPYLEPGFWTPFSKTPAAEFARFVALVKQGHPFMGRMVIGDRGASPELAEALKQQQKVDLERSLRYAQQTLGVGMAWRA
jgi:sugar phosphate isomerase/epimerase